MYKIKAVAPTSYQYNSLVYFGMKIKKVGNGSFVSEQYFDTEEQAKVFLVCRAENYYGDTEQINDALKDIAAAGILEIDTVVARIEEIFQEQ